MIPSLSVAQSNDRITVLLLGSDQRVAIEPELPQDELCTDTIMVLSIHTVQNTALMLSLPRDIYCQISPRHGWGRINTAYRLGEANGEPHGGGKLAIAAVEKLLQIPIDYYVLIDFAVFYAVMDAIGPITVCPRQEIYDDRFPDQKYGFMQVYFPAGCQELDSVRLLQYARVRHAAGYDFGRAQRQQEIIRSVRAKVLQPSVLFRLVRRSADLWRGIRSHIATNMPRARLLYVAVFFLQLPRENMYSGLPTVHHGQLRNVVTGRNEQALLPVPGKLRELVQLLFDSSPATVETKIQPETQPRDLGKRVQRLGTRIAFRMVLFLLRGWFVLQGLAKWA